MSAQLRRPDLTRLTVPSGKVGTVQSLSGTSVKCTEAERPIRAAIAVEG